MQQDLSWKIYTLRKKHNMTLEQVAEIVGVGKSTVRKWETGMIANMKRDKIALLAKALHTSPGYLMGWEQDPNPTETPDERHARWISEFEKLSDNGKQLLLDSIKKLESLSPEQKEMFLAMFAGAVASQADQPK